MYRYSHIVHKRACIISIMFSFCNYGALSPSLGLPVRLITHPANICSAPGSALCCSLPGGRHPCLWRCFGLSSLMRVKLLFSLVNSQCPPLVSPGQVWHHQSGQLCSIIWSHIGKENSLFIYLLSTWGKIDWLMICFIKTFSFSDIWVSFCVICFLSKHEGTTAAIIVVHSNHGYSCCSRLSRGSKGFH